MWFSNDKHKIGTENQKAEWLRIFEYCYDQALTCATDPELSVEQSILLLGIKAAVLCRAVEDGPVIEGTMNRRIMISWEKRETPLPDRSILHSLDLDGCHYTLLLGPTIYVMSMTAIKRMLRLASSAER